MLNRVFFYYRSKLLWYTVKEKKEIILPHGGNFFLIFLFS